MRHPDPHFGYPSASWRTREQPASLPPPPSRHRFLRQGTQVLDTHIDAIDWDSALQRIFTWGSRHQSRIVTFCRADTLVQASRDPARHRAIAQADLALPGDTSVAWAMRREGQRTQRALPAHELMWRHLARAEQAGQGVHCHGDNQEALDRLLQRIQADFPRLQVTGTAGALHPMTPAEDLALVHRITATGAQVVFLGLDEAEQDTWMSSHRGQVRAVMIGLGPAFAQPDVLATQPVSWRSRGQQLGRRTVFFARVLKSLLLGTPLSGHDDLR